MAKQVKVDNLIAAKSSLPNAPVSPRRMQLVANYIRGKNAVESVNFLTFDNRKASNYVLGVLKSAIANAQSVKGLESERLFVKDVHVGKGIVFKNRGVFGGRGRFKPMKKQSTNLTIILGEVSTPKVEAVPAEEPSVEKVEEAPKAKAKKTSKTKEAK